MVATIPSWLSMQIMQDELDVAPADGSKMEQKRMDASEALLEALDKSRRWRTLSAQGDY